MTTGKFVIGILTRLSISRCAVWAQAQHRKVWRSIPHTVVVSVRTSIRRISAPHAKHFIAAPAPRSSERSSHGGQKSAPRLWWRHTAGILERRWAVRVHGSSRAVQRPTERISTEIDLRRAMASAV